jgi:uncharacterized membrane protein YkgB
MIGCALTLPVGIAMRWAGVPGSGWVIGLSGAALVFLFLMPVMGARSREPADSPSRRAHWGD